MWVKKMHLKHVFLQWISVFNLVISLTMVYADKCKCGTASPLAFRIIGGVESMPHAFPWMVLIRYFEQVHCGGSLINDRYVLTAGHCVHRFNVDGLEVTVGLHEMGKLIPHESYTKKIERTIVHHRFFSKKLYDVNDIGLIKLRNPVPRFTEFVRPICLPLTDDPTHFDFVTGTVAGWGKTQDGDASSPFLMHASVKVISNKACKKTGLAKYLEDNMMCATNVSTDACQGDSGGPLMYISPEGRYTQIGIVSWGIDCAGVEPGVYTRVSSHLAWIYRQTRDAKYCLGSNDKSVNKSAFRKSLQQYP